MFLCLYLGNPPLPSLNPGKVKRGARPETGGGGGGDCGEGFENGGNGDCNETGKRFQNTSPRHNCPREHGRLFFSAKTRLCRRATSDTCRQCSLFVLFFFFFAFNCHIRPSPLTPCPILAPSAQSPRRRAGFFSRSRGARIGEARAMGASNPPPPPLGSFKPKSRRRRSLRSAEAVRSPFDLLDVCVERYTITLI